MLLRALRTIGTSCGAAAAAINALRKHAGDVEVARGGCGTLQNLAVTGENNLPLIRDGAGGVVIAALWTHADDVKVARAGCGAAHCRTWRPRVSTGSR